MLLSGSTTPIVIRNLLRASQSLPSLPDKLQSRTIASVSSTSPPKKLLAPAAFLSPLKTSRRRLNATTDFHSFGDPPPVASTANNNPTKTATDPPIRDSLSPRQARDTHTTHLKPSLWTPSPVRTALKTQRGDRDQTDASVPRPPTDNQLVQQEIAHEATLYEGLRVCNDETDSASQSFNESLPARPSAAPSSQKSVGSSRLASERFKCSASSSSRYCRCPLAAVHCFSSALCLTTCVRYADDPQTRGKERAQSRREGVR